MKSRDLRTLKYATAKGKHIGKTTPRKNYRPSHVKSVELAWQMIGHLVGTFIYLESIAS